MRTWLLFALRPLNNPRTRRTLIGLWFAIVLSATCLIVAAKFTGIERYPAGSRTLAFDAQLTCVDGIDAISIEFHSIVYSDSTFPFWANRALGEDPIRLHQIEFEERLLDGNPWIIKDDDDHLDARLVVVAVSDASSNRSDDDTKGNCEPRLILSVNRPITTFRDKDKGIIAFDEGATEKSAGSPQSSLDNFLDSDSPYDNVYSIKLKDVLGREIYIHFRDSLVATRGIAGLGWRQRLSGQTDQPGSESVVHLENAVEYSSRFDGKRLSPGVKSVLPTAVSAGDTHRIAVFASEFTDSRDKHPFLAAEISPNHEALVEIAAEDPEMKDVLEFVLFCIAAILGAAVSAVVEMIVALFRNDRHAT
jgi:hypothetical protein